MKIGNKPPTIALAQKGKVYWELSIGRDALKDRFLNDGWRGFHFVVYRPYKTPQLGETVAYKIRIAFAFWLPFYKI